MLRVPTLFALLMGLSAVACGPVTVGPVDHSCHNQNCPWPVGGVHTPGY
jgi:hypothetical protein